MCIVLLIFLQFEPCERSLKVSQAFEVQMSSRQKKMLAYSLKAFQDRGAECILYFAKFLCSMSFENSASYNLANNFNFPF